MTLPGFTECPECAGSGTVITEASNVAGESLTGCPSCSGAGVVPDPETVEAFAQRQHDIAGLPLDDELRERVRAALLSYAQHAKETE